MLVFIEGTPFECHDLLHEDGRVARWNGWVRPIFTTEQMREVIAFGVLEGWEGCEEGWREVGPDRWMVDGWIWDLEDVSA